MDRLKDILKSHAGARRAISALRTLPERHAMVGKAANWYAGTEMGIAAAYHRIVRQRRALTVTRPLPAIREIEINNYCNLDCVMCRSSLSSRKARNMSPALFEKVIAHVRTSDPYGIVALHTIGEPLLNPLLEEYLALLKKYGIRVQLSTNGQTLDEKLPLLCRYAEIIHGIRFSIDGACEETYEKIRVHGKFRKLLENLDLFAEANRGGRYFRRVTIDSVVSTDVQHELAFHLAFYSKYTGMENIHLNLVNGLCPDNRYFFCHSVLKKHIVKTFPCLQLSGNMHILNDGSVTACCRDYDGDLVFGNIETDSPENLINNDSIVRLRRDHLGQRPMNALCDGCYEINPAVSQLFKLFVKSLVLRNRHSWNIEQMQSRFERFFAAFSEGVPDCRQYLSLMR